ncbi:MAG: aminotransferase class I/II-fold pyridoxal phosphate-dependent enzyme [Pirellulaceae bacterium]
MNVNDRITDYLNHLPDSDRRHLRVVERLDGGRVRIDGREFVDFASNDYLGLSRHAQVIAAAGEWAQRYGAGAGASRLISGNLAACEQLERKIARLKGSESALLIGSGFQTAAGVLAALTDRRLFAADSGRLHVFTDRLCHASTHFGLAAAGIRQHRFRHNDLDHIERLLQQHVTNDDAALIVCESVYSMDGDRLDAERMRELAAQYRSMLFVDEAHATGVLGQQGMGLVSNPADHEVVLCTFGKALGSYGACVVCSAELRKYLVNRCAALIYSTALPPAVLGMIDAALDLVTEMDTQRNQLQKLSDHLRAQLSALGLDTSNSSTAIVPALLGDSKSTLQVAAGLLERGFLVGAIRRPTVPEGTARLRISLSAVHIQQHVDELVHAIGELVSQKALS